MSTEKHTKEPWRLEENVHAQGINHLAITARHEEWWMTCSVTPMEDCLEVDRANGNRIVSCVNACAGIADPQAAIQSAREALEVFVAAHKKTLEPYYGEPDALLDKGFEALALLNGSPDKDGGAK